LKTLHLLFLLLICFSANAQKSDSTRTYYKIIRGTIEHATELKSKRYVRNGAAEIISGRKIIASGLYKDDLRYGRWSFFNAKDSLEQVYNYTTKKVEFNLRDKHLSYYIDSLKTGDKVIYPIKVGGVNYAMYYLLNVFKVPYELRRSLGNYDLFYIFNLDESGKLIKFETKIASLNYNKIDVVDLAKLKAEDLEFAPAVLNGRKVASTIVYESKIIVE